MRVMRYYDADIKENVFVIQESDPITKIVQLQYTGATKGSGEKDLTLKISNLLGTVDVILFVDGNRIETKQVTSNGGGAVTTTFKYTFVDEFSHQLLFRVNGNEFCTGNKLLVEYEGTALPASIELSASETVLMPPEQSVLSALVKNEVGEPVKGVSVSFNIGITKQTATTDSTGVATTTYTSTANGDLQTTATVGEVTSNTIIIEDCTWFDNATTDKTSQYDLEGYTQYLTFNHNTDDYTVSYNHSKASTQDRSIIKMAVNHSDNFIFELDVQVTSSTNGSQYGMDIYRGYTTTSTSGFQDLHNWQHSNNIGMGKYNGNTWTEISRISGYLPKNVWLKFRFTVVDGATVKGEIINLDTSTTLFNHTANYTILDTDSLGWVLSTGTMNMKMKNFKVKEI